MDFISSKENFEAIRETIAEIKNIPSVSGDTADLSDFDNKPADAEEISL